MGRPVYETLIRLRSARAESSSQTSTRTLALELRTFAVFKYNFVADMLTPRNQASRRPKVAKGCIDIHPQQMPVRDTLLNLVRNAFVRFGAVAIDTPVFELKETLMGKYGEDQKLIFDLKDQGGEQLALRYDLTVPFARYCSSYNVERIKRFHIAKVYRRDEPQMARGRYREFFQCDFDIAGDYDPMVADAEVISCGAYVFRQLKPLLGPFVIRVNHRSLLDILMLTCGIPSSLFKGVCSAIDKLDKNSWEEVEHELCHIKGVAADAATRLRSFVGLKGPLIDIVTQLRRMPDVMQHQGSQDVMNGLEILNKYLKAAGCNDDVILDLSLARGLEYYTGVIYEIGLEGAAGVGSVGAGGRYDGLLGMFSGRSIPAVGLSVGVERLFRVLENSSPQIKGWSETTFKPQGVDVVVCSVGDNLLRKRIELARILRDGGIAADYLYQERAKLGKQLSHANDLGAPLAVIFGDEEIQRGTCKVRELIYGDEDQDIERKEVEKLVEDLVMTIRMMLHDKKRTTSS